MARCCPILMLLLAVLPVAGVASAVRGAALNSVAPAAEDHAVLEAKWAWDDYLDALDASRGCLPVSGDGPGYQVLRANFPAAIKAFGLRFEKRQRLHPQLNLALHFFPEAEQRELIRAAVRHYVVGDPNTPFLHRLARIGTAEDMRRLQGYIRRHPDSSFPADYMLECENPYAHVALAEMADLPGAWRKSAGMPEFLAELEKVRPSVYAKLKWIGMMGVLLPAAVWLSARRRQEPRYRRCGSGASRSET